MAEEASAMDPIQIIRASNRMNLSALRSKDREDLLKQRRVSLLEAESLVADISLPQFKELCLKLKNKKTTFDVLRAIKMSCFSPGRTEAFMKTENALNTLIRVLVGRDARMQLEAAACLTNLVCGSHKASHRIAKACGPYLVSFLGSGSPYLQDQCAWACGNMANCCFPCFTLLKAQGLVPALLANIQSPVPDVIRSTMFALNACTKYVDEDLRDLADDHTVNSLLKLLEREHIHPTAKSDAIFTLSNIIFSLSKNRVEISDSTVETILIHLEKSALKDDFDIKLSLPLVRCLGFASTAKNTCLYIVQELKFKTVVSRILNSNCLHLFQEVICVLTNIIGCCCDLSSDDVDLNAIFRNIHLNTSNHLLIVQVLYFLCSWASRNKNIRIVLLQKEYSSVIEELLSCGEKTVEKAVQVILHIITS
ncbi:hypothetical protein JTE90_017705 [Oedothorax gibbosus]|uniref:Armadillo repeat-containing protein 8 n=1 Tax=Oedothorax gibbosus TaxID=931172 RepID=A0AAV6U975_9ARAC|nr:hypothetical protein JTE90_017705 [Oedothorax gibbosus]